MKQICDGWDDSIFRPIPLQMPEDQQEEDQEADVHQGPLPKSEGFNPAGPKFF